MRAFLSLIRFELKFQLTGPTFIMSFGFFFLMTFAATVSDQVQIGGPSSVNINAPGAIAMTLAILGIFGLFIPTAILASGVIRDQEFKTSELFHSTPVGPKAFVLGRFTGGLIATLLAFASVPLALYLGCQMPWIDPEKLGPMRMYDFVYFFTTLSVVNLTVIGLVFFTVSNLTRSVFATYVTLILFLVIYFVGLNWAREPEFRSIAAIADPLGVNTLREMMRYWTPAQQNTDLVPFSGVYLINRVVWSAIAVALLVLNLFLFRFRTDSKASKKQRAQREKVIEKAVERVAIPRVAPEKHASFTQLLARVRFEAKSVVRSPAFWILLALGVLNSVGGLLNIDSLYGSDSYPLTRIMLDMVQGTFSIIPLIVAVYYASELVWRERVVGISEVVDATPTPSWVFVVSKFVALSVVIVSLFIAAVLTALLIQLGKGFTAVELGQYAERLMIDMVLPMTLLAVLCIVFQVITNNRWLGILAVVFYIIIADIASEFGYDHSLLIYGSSPGKTYSDMNGYGHFLRIESWFSLYWAFWAAALGILSYVLWNRGALRPIASRLKSIPNAARSAKILLLVAVAGIVLSGSWIFYNTNILNTYMNEPRTEERALAFEDKYRERFEDLKQPKITSVEVAVDIFPHERRTRFEGAYDLVNWTGASVDTVLVDYSYGAEVKDQNLDGSTLEEFDSEHNVYRFSISPPWPAGETRILSFSTERANRGFRNDSNTSSVVDNGTFLNNTDGMPLIGFNSSKLLQPREIRRRYDREPLPRAPDLDDAAYFTQGMLRPDSDWVEFAATVSTVPEQIAIAPGYLAREWQEDGRRYFRYEMDRPIQNFFSFQSADYAVEEEVWNGIQLQVFYHPEHDYNVPRIMEAMRDSLAYFSDVFSPFQYRQMRVLEFPAYADFAQSFANTVPFSEGIGFVIDLRDAKSFDVVYYVTAHEVAHQWFAHQVLPSPNQGATMIVETFAQYGALIALEKKYGRHQMRRFLKYELDRYLSGRANEPEAEKPLYRVENQPYIHYRKGAVVMYALRDRLGEDVVNRSIARFIKEWGGKTDPYPRTTDFLAILRDEAGPENDQLITDLFEKIVLYDLRVTDTNVSQQDDGRFAVSMTVTARKLEADEKGAETEVPLNLPIDVGVFSKDLEDVYEGQEHVLVFEKRPIVSGEQTFEFIVDKKPLVIGIDPYNTLIDRQSDDNIKRVTAVGGS